MITYDTLADRRTERGEFEQQFTDQIKDTSIPLEERWELFYAAVHQGVFHKLYHTYGSKILESKKNFSWYDTLYIQRYETVKYIDIIDMFEDQLEDALDPAFSKTIEECVIQSAEELNALKEEFLATGYSGFKYNY